MAPISKLGRGKRLKNQTKEVLHKLYRYFETEIDRDPNSTVTAAQLVTHSTGVSSTAIKRVLTDYKNQSKVKKETKTNKRRCKKNVLSDDSDAQAIRKLIHNFYTKDEEFPIMKDLYLILKGDIDYQGSLCTLRRQVTKLGFKWMEKEDNNRMLIEKHDFRYTRIQYLTKIDEYRSQGRSIVYTGETCIESNRIASKPKPDGSLTILKQPAKSKLTILLAGGDCGVLKNTLYMFDASSKREYKEEVDSKKEGFEQHERWLKFNLIPNLKPNSIVVVDGGSLFHSRLSNPTPHFNSPKKDIMDYLTSRNVPYSSDMYKSQLYQLVLITKDKYCDFKTDALLRDQGHTVLRLPPNHPDLCPIKNILSSVKEYIGKDVCLSVESVMKVAKEKVYSFLFEDWTLACRCAEAEENSLKSIDKVIDDISDGAFRSDVESSDSEMEDEIESDVESMDSD